ncbi:MATE family efflux transporter [Oscillatoria sp. FACHB-1407]|uniref:MATE family efflux transporter n=1 Tax=Oscillatoria sp. FACHB-1407 TaxID=2692847 RepID=UPI001687C9E1|nr:MATE family efflux transporter [Oscillatoria sp. FACHB-1407]MBD2463638.1 MATE family efflux transporter [Oscillatoria sp. FACHB-1407]
MTTLNAYQLNIRAEFEAFLQLAIPLASAQVAQLATGFVDTVMMGHLGRETLAAGALASITFFSIVVTTSGVVMGISPLVAEAFGAGNKTRIEQVTRQGLWLSLLLAIPIMIAIAHLDRVMLQLGQSPAMVELAKEYLNIMLWGLFPALGFAMLRGVVSALSQARPIFMIVIAGTGFNVVGNYVFGFGKFGFPRLELAGLALASVLTLWGMFGALVVYLFTHKQFKTYQFSYRLHQLKPQVLWELVKLGTPIGVFSALEIGVYTAVSYLMGAWGTDGLAAHQIVFQTMNLIFMVPLGMSFAATARIGQWFGQQNLAGIRQAGFVSLAVGTAWTILVAIAFLVFPQHIIGLYIDINAPENAAIVALATAMMRVGAIAHLFDGIQKIAYGALQGLQDTRVPMVLSFVFYWCIGLTSGYWLGFGWNLGGVGLWLGLTLAVAIAALIFVWRFQTLTSNEARIKLFS